MPTIGRYIRPGCFQRGRQNFVQKRLGPVGERRRNKREKEHSIIKLLRR